MLRKKWRIVKNRCNEYFIQYTRLGIMWSYVGTWEDDGYESSYFRATPFLSVDSAEAHIMKLVSDASNKLITSNGHEIIKTFGRLK